MLRLTMMTQEGEVVIGELTKTGCAAKWAFGMDMQRDGRSIQRWRRFPPGMVVADEGGVGDWRESIEGV